jgi:hypothetical protein
MSEAGYLLLLGLHYGRYEHPYSPVWSNLTRLGYVKFFPDGHHRYITPEGYKAMEEYDPREDQE